MFRYVSRASLSSDSLLSNFQFLAVQGFDKQKGNLFGIWARLNPISSVVVGSKRRDKLRDAQGRIEKPRRNRLTAGMDEDEHWLGIKGGFYVLEVRESERVHDLERVLCTTRWLETARECGILRESTVLPSSTLRRGWSNHISRSCARECSSREL